MNTITSRSCALAQKGSYLGSESVCTFHVTSIAAPTMPKSLHGVLELLSGQVRKLRAWER